MWYVILSDKKKYLFCCVNNRTIPKMKFLLLIFVIVQMFRVYAQEEPTILKVSRTQERNIGDSTELKCTVANADDYPIVWLKDRGSKKSPQQLSKGPSITVEDDRYSLIFDKATSSYNLKIDDLQRRDAGLYKCEIQLSDTDIVSADIVLKLSSDGSAFS